MLKHFVLFSLIFFPTLVCSEPVHPYTYAGDLKKTIDNVLEAYGGRENILRIKTISAHGRIDDFLRKKSGGYARTMRRPGELRIDIMPEKGGEVRVLSKSSGLQGSGRRLRRSSPLSLSSMRYQYGYLDLPMSLAEGETPAKHMGLKELHGRPMEILSVTLKDAPKLTVYIDFETHLIQRVEATFRMGEMGNSLLATEYDDFRKVDDIVFPFKLYNYAGRKNISLISLVRLIINQKLSDKTFPVDELEISGAEDMSSLISH